MDTSRKWGKFRSPLGLAKWNHRGCSEVGCEGLCSGQMYLKNDVNWCGFHMWIDVNWCELMWIERCLKVESSISSLILISSFFESHNSLPRKGPHHDTMTPWTIQLLSVPETCRQGKGPRGHAGGTSKVVARSRMEFTASAYQTDPGTH